MIYSPRVYLAGAIAGISGQDATDWRRYASERLRDLHIEAMSPMRAKGELSRAPKISSTFHDYEARGVFYTPAGVMTRDHADVMRADALLVNLLGTKSISAGTAMELAWAWDHHKPAVIAIEEGNPHLDHPMIFQAMPFRVATLDDAIDAVAVVLNR